MSSTIDINEEGEGSRPVNLLTTPLWKYTTVVQNSVNGGGNKIWKCNFCTKQVKGSYSKVRGHLLHIKGKGVGVCEKVTDDILKEMKREEEEVKLKKLTAKEEEQKKSDYLSLPPGSDLKQPKKRKGNQSGSALERAFKAKERDELDKQCARMFYSAALPFNFARNPYFRSFCKNLANSNVDLYVPPPYERLRTTMRVQEKAHLSKLIEPTRNSWVKKGVSICSDAVSRPIINIMGASGTSAVFIDSADASRKRKDASYVLEVFLDAIEEVGAQNVVQIVTYNGPNFKATGNIVEEKYPHIFWPPCIVHCVNLAFKSLCEPSDKSAHFDQCIWLQDLCTSVHEIQKFVTTHDMVKAIFNKHSKLQLLSVAETRFASHYVVAEHMKQVKEALEQMVMDTEFRALFKSTKNSIDIKARECKEKILSDNWWDSIKYFLKFAEPIYQFLVYDVWDSMIEKVKVIVYEHEGKDIQSGISAFFDAIQGVLVSRWNKSNTPLHSLAHSLVPRYYSTNWLKGNTTGFPRVAPNEDVEVSNHRNECFRRLFPNPDDFKHVRVEYGAFSSEVYPFNQAYVVSARDEEEPIIWWENYDSSLPHLQSLAIKLLSQPASSSCCEQNWSHYGNNHTLKRNRLKSEKARDLVYCHNILRQLSRKEDSYKSGPSRYWTLVEIILMWMRIFVR